MGTQLSVSSVRAGKNAGTDNVGTFDIIGLTIYVGSMSETRVRIAQATVSGNTVTWGTVTTFAFPTGLPQIAGGATGPGGRLFYSFANGSLSNSRIVAL